MNMLDDVAHDHRIERLLRIWGGFKGPYIDRNIPFAAQLFGCPRVHILSRDMPTSVLEVSEPDPTTAPHIQQPTRTMVLQVHSVPALLVDRNPVDRGHENRTSQA